MFPSCFRDEKSPYISGIQVSNAIVAVGVSLFFAAATPSAEPLSAPWKTISPGVEHLHLVEENADLFRFDLSMFRAEVVVQTGNRPRTAAEMRADHNALLAINGGFFDEDVRPLGLRVSGSRTVVPLRPRVDWGVLELRHDGAAIVHGRDYRAHPAITDAIQVGPRLLVDGQALGLKPQQARRTAVALDREGRFLTVIATRARVEANALAHTLERLGFDRALMLDGGPSTQLSAAIGDVHVEISGGYPVPDGLVVRARESKPKKKP
jgi:uncharacterized protein YigE (DUF2233 family)